MAFNERNLEQAKGAQPAAEPWVEQFLADQQTSAGRNSSNRTSENTTSSPDVQTDAGRLPGTRPRIPPGHVYTDFDPQKWMSDLDADGNKHITRAEVGRFENDVFTRFGKMDIKDFQRSSALLYNLDLIQNLSDDDQGSETGVTIKDLQRLSELASQPAKNDNEAYLAKLFKGDQ